MLLFFLSKEQNISLSTVYPIVHGLVGKLDATEEDSGAFRSFKVKVAAAIRRWDLDSLDVTQVSVLATALDPRFRSLKFLMDDKRLAVKAKLLQLANSAKRDFERETMESADTDSHSRNGSGTDSPTEAAPAPKRKKTAFDVLLGEEETNGDSTNNEEQISQYFAEKPAPRDCYPLNWWKQNEFRFKYLAKIARSILCVPATSTASERLFSTAGLTVTKLRSCLKPENVDALLFLNKNFEYLYQ